LRGVLVDDDYGAGALGGHDNLRPGYGHGRGAAQVAGGVDDCHARLSQLIHPHLAVVQELSPVAFVWPCPLPVDAYAMAGRDVVLPRPG